MGDNRGRFTGSFRLGVLPAVITGRGFNDSILCDIMVT